MPLRPLAEFYDHSCSDCLSYLLPPKNIFFTSPCEVVFLLKHKNLFALLKLMIKEIEEIYIQTSLSVTDFIDFLSAGLFVNRRDCLEKSQLNLYKKTRKEIVTVLQS